MPALVTCLDLDTFFVSVERLLDPSLVGKPVIVGGRPGERGVVTAASYEVRALGVRAGMSMTDATRLAPHAVFLPTRHDAYGPYAERVREVLERWCPAVVTASIDEFFMDFTGCVRLYHQPEDVDADHTILRIVRRMREQVQEEVGLPASAGIGTTRPIAKIASGLAKPAGVRLVPTGSERSFLADLPVRKFPGIGPVAEARLVDAGIPTLGCLLELPAGPLRAQFARFAASVEAAVEPVLQVGIGQDRPAFHEHDPVGSTVGSISNERTFSADLRSVDRVDEQLRALVERVCWRARKRGVTGRTISVRLRYADFQTLSRSKTGPPGRTERDLLAVARELLKRGWTRRTAIRLVGVELSNLEPVAASSDLFEAAAPDPSSAVDAVRERFGYDAIRIGAVKRPRRASG